MLYSKNGSIPKDHISGSKQGWEEVDPKPECPDGKELIWWYPPGWVIRDPKPAATATTDWSWSQSEERWMEYNIPSSEVSVEVSGGNDLEIIGGATAGPIIMPSAGAL